MKKVLPLFFLLAVQASCRSPSSAPERGMVDEARAEAIARGEFLKYTDNKIPHYLIHKPKQTETKWLFEVTRDEEFVGPGHFWFVEVDKVSGKAVVDEGR